MEEHAYDNQSNHKHALERWQVADVFLPGLPSFTRLGAKILFDSIGHIFD